MDKTTIENTLIDIGMPTGIKGFSYIVETIMLLDRPEWKDPKWTSVYYCVGRMYDMTGSSVERAIRHALKTTRDRNNDYDAIEYYIGFSNCENSNSLMRLYYKLKQKENKNNTVITKYMLKQTLLELINS